MKEPEQIDPNRTKRKGMILVETRYFVYCPKVDKEVDILRVCAKKPRGDFGRFICPYFIEWNNWDNQKKFTCTY